MAATKYTGSGTVLESVPSHAINDNANNYALCIMNCNCALCIMNYAL